MADTISTRLQVQGERQYVNAIKDANANLRVLRSELQRDTSALGANASQQDKNRVKTQNLNKQYEQQKKIVEENKKRLEQLKKKYGENSTEVRNMEIKLNSSITAMNNTRNQIDRLNDGLESLGKQSNKTGTEISEKLLKNLEFNQAIEKFKTFGNAAKGALDGITNSAKAIVTQISSIVKEVASEADYIVTLSQTSGLSIDTLNKLSYAQAAGFDITMEQFAAASTGLTKKHNTTKGKALYGKGGDLYGVDQVTEADGTKRDATPEELFWNVMGWASANYKQGENDDYIESVLNKAGMDAAGMMPYLKDGGAQALDDIINKGLEEGKIRNEEQTKMLGSIQDTIDSISATIKSIRQLFVIMFADSFGDITSGVDDLMTAINKYENAIIAGDTDAANEAFGEAKGSLNKILEGIGSLIDGLWENLKKAIASLASDVDENNQPTLIGRIATTIEGLMTWFDSGGFQTLWSGITSTFDTIKTIIESIARFLGIRSAKEKLESATVQLADTTGTLTVSEGASEEEKAYVQETTMEAADLIEAWYDIMRGDYSGNLTGDDIYDRLGTIYGDPDAPLRIQNAVEEYADQYLAGKYTGEDLPLEYMTQNDFVTSMQTVTEKQGESIKAASVAGANAIVGAIGSSLKDMGFFVDGQQLAAVTAPYIDNIIGSGMYIPMFGANPGGGTGNNRRTTR